MTISLSFFKQVFTLIIFSCTIIQNDMLESMTSTRVMAIDPGEKRIGIAISDLSGSIATPLYTIMHVSHIENAKKIIELAKANQVACIIIGQALDEDGRLTHSAIRANRLGEQITLNTTIPVKYWDETGTTLQARKSRLEMGLPRKKRHGHHDAIAATLILQDYLDFHNPFNGEK